MSTASLIDAERNFLEYSSPPYSDNDGRQDVLIYMIGGNPGLIGYYQPFLSSLHNLLQSSPISQRARFSVCGYSLAGFEDGHVSGSPVGLLETITDTENQLYGHVESHQRSHTGSGKPLKVILMGHSVGAYILLELIQHHKQKVDSGNEDFDLIGGILLFPTITHIAKSPSGMVASVSNSFYTYTLRHVRSYISSLADTPKDPICSPCRWRYCTIFILPSSHSDSLQHHQISHALSRPCSEDNHKSDKEPDGHQTSVV